MEKLFFTEISFYSQSWYRKLRLCSLELKAILAAIAIFKGTYLVGVMIFFKIPHATFSGAPCLRNTYVYVCKQILRICAVLADVTD